VDNGSDAVCYSGYDCYDMGFVLFIFNEFTGFFQAHEGVAMLLYLLMRYFTLI